LNQAQRTLTEEGLQERLITRSSRLHWQVARKIPPCFKSVVSVDDILQEVWIAAFRGLPSFRANRPDAFDRWVTTLVERKVVDACRAARALKRGGDRRAVQNNRSLLSSFVDVFDRVTSGGQTPSRDASAKEAALMVRIALGSLPDDRRRAIWMRHIEGRPLAEIAEEMQKTNAAVHSLLFNGLRQLRRRLGRAAKFFSDASEEVPRRAEAV
jgi:RNA polymerase sigma factor (sigma-70 family)